jgi:hypothetical protein
MFVSSTKANERRSANRGLKSIFSPLSPQALTPPPSTNHFSYRDQLIKVRSRKEFSSEKTRQMVEINSERRRKLCPSLLIFIARNFFLLVLAG